MCKIPALSSVTITCVPQMFLLDLFDTLSFVKFVVMFRGPPVAVYCPTIAPCSGLQNDYDRSVFLTSEDTTIYNLCIGAVLLGSMILLRN